MEFKVGDRIMINKLQNFSDRHKQGEVGLVGTIIKDRGGAFIFRYIIRYDNERFNNGNGESVWAWHGDELTKANINKRIRGDSIV